MSSLVCDLDVLGLDDLDRLFGFLQSCHWCRTRACLALVRSNAPLDQCDPVIVNLKLTREDVPAASDYRVKRQGQSADVCHRDDDKSGLTLRRNEAANAIKHEARHVSLASQSGICMVPIESANDK